MALAFSELHDDRGASRSRENSQNSAARAYRSFIVPGYSESVALAHPSLPAVNAPHPDFPNLLASNWETVRRIGAGSDAGWVIRVTYDKARVGSFGAPPSKSDIDYRSFDGRTYGFWLDVPVIYPVEYVGPIPPGGGPPQTDIDYKIEWEKIRIRSIVIRPVVNVPGELTDTEIATILSRTDEVHEFWGGRWRFNGANWSQSRSTGTHIVYEWLGDPGNDAMAVTPDIPPGTIGYPARLGHQYYKPFYVGPPSYWTIIAMEPLRLNPNGYQGLPGVPIP